jgi:CheY-like chemotaxis protein/anti-sigma regulatory factor (Ser/Thr protein kinase)
VRQIAFNLVGNAIKFTNDGSVRLSCKVHPRRDTDNVILEVEDTGIGIPDERLEAVFDVFEQADNSVTRRHGGTGLGLAISRQLARRMHGDIEVRSTLGEGSVFTVRLTLPICEPPESVQADRGEELPYYELHALVVEDNPVNQLVTRRMLKKLGITAGVAEDGAAALEALEQERYDLVFMDVRMPVLDGYEATRRIRARDDALADIPIVALTAEATQQARTRCLEAGMNVHLPKPVRIDRIVEAVDACLAWQKCSGEQAGETPAPLSGSRT